jgi:heme-degrading monooxygenase HmoA
MTVVSVLRLRVREGAGPELVRRFAELEIFEHSRRGGGFRGGRLLRPLTGDGAYLVVAEWDSAAAYRGWLDNPVRAELGEQLEPLIDGEVASGELFEEV